MERKRDVTLKRPVKLMEMISGLLEKLHGGLQMLGQDRREKEKFFEALTKLHQPVLKLRRLKSRRDAEESSAVPLEADELPATPHERRDLLRAQTAGQPWLGRDDLDAAGFEDTLPTAPGELAEMDDSPAPKPSGPRRAPPKTHRLQSRRHPILKQHSLLQPSSRRVTHARKPKPY